MCHPVDPYVGMRALMYELMNDLIVRSTIQDYSQNHAHQLGLRICLLFAVVPPALRSLAPDLHRQAEDSSCNGRHIGTTIAPRVVRLKMEEQLVLMMM